MRPICFASASSFTPAKISPTMARASTAIGLGRHPPDSMRDRSSRSSTIRCIRWVLARIVWVNCARCAWGSVSSRSVSAKPLTTVRGVRNSCDTLATKSRRTVSRRRIGVTSRMASTAPPPSNGRAVSATDRSLIWVSSASVDTPAIAAASASRSTRSRGSRSAEKGTASRTPNTRRAPVFMWITCWRPSSAMTPSLSDSVRARSRASSASKACTRAPSCSANRWKALASSPTSPGAASDGRRDKSPEAMARASSRSSRIGRVTERAKIAARMTAATMESAAADKTSRCARCTMRRWAAVETETRAIPSWTLRAEWSSSLLAEVERRTDDPEPVARAAKTSGRLR